MEELTWWLTQSAPGGTLLLVAVDAAPQGAGAYPCRVVGAVSALAHPAERPSASIPSAPPENRIRELLSTVGVPANLLGFAYLLTALTLMQQEPAVVAGCAGLAGALARRRSRTNQPALPAFATPPLTDTFRSFAFFGKTAVSFLSSVPASKASTAAWYLSASCALTVLVTATSPVAFTSG